MLSKKGMAIGQIFIFIVAAVTFTLVLLFGYQKITGFLETGEQVEFIQFKNHLESSIQKIYTEYGAIRKTTFHPPGQYTQVCFVDFEFVHKKTDIDLLCEKDPFACGTLEDASAKFEDITANVFLTPIAPVPIKTHKIKVEALEKASGFDKHIPKGFLCLSISGGQFELTMEGMGDHTLLWEPKKDGK